ncbi:MAG: hypothetical protein NWQ37_02945, partial [Marivita lacus]|nr:hypothetical protein [Marivita lacus]
MPSLKNIAADPPPVQKTRRVFDGSFMVLLVLTLAGGVAVGVVSGWARVGQILIETFEFIAM